MRCRNKTLQGLIILVCIQLFLMACTSNKMELGGQTLYFKKGLQMRESGMTWVKLQNKWQCGDNPHDLMEQIDSAHTEGFQVILSIQGESNPSTIDFDCYSDFLAEVAAIGPDAIEVWNRMNLDSEWPAGSIDPASYVNNMLKPAYSKIKERNSNVIVIGGALASTGYFGGGCSSKGCDDNSYLEGMAAAGAADYMDCMGVHYTLGATSPSAKSGHPADDGSGHYSWYYQPMIDLYAETIGQPLCITALGYPAPTQYDAYPFSVAWAENITRDQQAKWLAEAVKIAAESKKVQMIIIFNFDLGVEVEPIGETDETKLAKLYAIHRSGNVDCLACVTLREAMNH